MLLPFYTISSAYQELTKLAYTGIISLDDAKVMMDILFFERHEA